MGPAGQPLPPSSSLPPLRRLGDLSETQIAAALDNLFAIYCPAAVLKSALGHASTPYKLYTRFAPLTDSGYNSGYTSGNEDDEDSIPEQDTLDTKLALLRADDFERTFTIRWLESLMTRGEDELPCFSSDETRDVILERAADLLTALLNPQQQHDEGEPENHVYDDYFCRDFTFALPGRCGHSSEDNSAVSVRIKDGLAGSRSADHLDVGLQTWGASIVLCQMLCESPSRFGLAFTCLGSSPRIVELGAGTGLVSLVLGQLLPRLSMERALVVATDYHPSVVSNLCSNISANAQSASGMPTSPVHACVLDWAQTERPPAWPLGDEKADILLGTDVVYAPEHANMLYKCASTLLAPEGIFWLLVTARQNGRFNGVDETVEAVFGGEARSPSPITGRTLSILGAERLEKRNGVGRGDETFYKLFRIGWA